MAMRPCLGVNGQHCGHLTTGSRCPTHRRQRDNTTLRGKRTRRPYSRAEQDRRAAAVAAHRTAYGDWCPGWQVAEHRSTDLTADHVTAVASGGSEDGPLEVLCRSCNGRKGSNAGS